MNPVEELISEETLIDEVEIPGLPQDEAERRQQWRKHRQLGHVLRQMMIHLLRAVRSEFTDKLNWWHLAPNWWQLTPALPACTPTA